MNKKFPPSSQSAFDNLLNLLNSLEADLTLFQDIIAKLAQIEGPYQARFKQLQLLGKFQNNQLQNKEYEKAIHAIVEVFSQFSQLMEEIMQEEDESAKYIQSGLVEKYRMLQENLVSKYNIE